MIIIIVISGALRGDDRPVPLAVLRPRDRCRITNNYYCDYSMLLLLLLLVLLLLLLLLILLLLIHDILLLLMLLILTTLAVLRPRDRCRIVSSYIIYNTDSVLLH